MQAAQHLDQEFTDSLPEPEQVPVQSAHIPLFQRWAQKRLAWFTRRIIKKYQPEIIAVTGSVGKTSTKEAIYTVLKAGGFSVRASQKNYNNEFGVPFTVIGSDVHGARVFEWMQLEKQAWKLLFSRDLAYPKILILEMAADHPGDIEYLVNLIPAHIGIVSAIGDEVPVHVEFFKNIEHLVREKRHMVEHLKKDDIAILNRDDELVWDMHEKTKGRVVSIGTHAEADIQALEVAPTQAFGQEPQQPVTGMSFKLKTKGSIIPVFLPHALGATQVTAALFAVAVGMEHAMNLIDIAQGLRDFRPPPGRTNLIAGIKHTLIIDDSYNSSPTASVSALRLLAQIPGKQRKIAVLGDMAELGKFTEESHRAIGKLVAELAIDVLVTVGQRAFFIAEAAQTNGLINEKVIRFSSAAEAGRFIQSELHPGDIILVKGSQSMRMEKVVKEIMAEPLLAGQLLVRQDSSWLARL